MQWCVRDSITARHMITGCCQLNGRQHHGLRQCPWSRGLLAAWDTHVRARGSFCVRFAKEPRDDTLCREGSKSLRIPYQRQPFGNVSRSDEVSLGSVPCRDESVATCQWLTIRTPSWLTIASKGFKHDVSAWNANITSTLNHYHNAIKMKASGRKARSSTKTYGACACPSQGACVPGPRLGLSRKPQKVSQCWLVWIAFGTGFSTKWGHCLAFLGSSTKFVAPWTIFECANSPFGGPFGAYLGRIGTPLSSQERHQGWKFLKKSSQKAVLWKQSRKRRIVYQLGSQRTVFRLHETHVFINQAFPTGAQMDTKWWQNGSNSVQKSPLDRKIVHKGPTLHS